jgi:hypothetical protein
MDCKKWRLKTLSPGERVRVRGRSDGEEEALAFR